jgi:hypothetical protein
MKYKPKYAIGENPFTSFWWYHEQHVSSHEICEEFSILSLTTIWKLDKAAVKSLLQSRNINKQW